MFLFFFFRSSKREKVCAADVRAGRFSQGKRGSEARNFSEIAYTPEGLSAEMSLR